MRLRCFCLMMQCLLSYCAFTHCYDLFVGYDFGARMSYTEVKKQGLLFFKRHQTVSIDYPIGTTITGIACVDLSAEKNGEAIITEGGIDSNYVKINFEGARSAGLRYVVEIYTSPFKEDKDNDKQKENNATNLVLY